MLSVFSSLQIWDSLPPKPALYSSLLLTVHTSIDCALLFELAAAPYVSWEQKEHFHSFNGALHSSPSSDVFPPFLLSHFSRPPPSLSPQLTSSTDLTAPSSFIFPTFIPAPLSLPLLPPAPPSHHLSTHPFTMPFSLIPPSSIPSFSSCLFSDEVIPNLYYMYYRTFLHSL